MSIITTIEQQIINEQLESIFPNISDFSLEVTINKDGGDWEREMEEFLKFKQ